ncbi:MAG: hypothetical protein OXD43_05415 [Bacteroidetes bacterium]|nr:hypothetical protein [Bacteroidota bacterium]
MRSVIARTGLIEFLTERLYDPRKQYRMQYSLAQSLLQWLLQLIQGWSALWTEQLNTDAAFGTSTRIKRCTGFAMESSILSSELCLKNCAHKFGTEKFVHFTCDSRTDTSNELLYSIENPV